MNKNILGTTRAVKLLTLYHELLRTRRKYTLNDIADLLECTKSTASRLVRDLICSGTGHSIEEGKHGKQIWIRIPPDIKRTSLSMTQKDLEDLVLFQELVFDILPHAQRDKLHHIICQSAESLYQGERRADLRNPKVKTLPKGSVAAKDKSREFELLINAMDTSRVCNITYSSYARPEPHQHLVVPFELIRYGDTLYFKCWKLSKDDDGDEPFAMTLALHRIDSVEHIDRRFHKKPPSGKTDQNLFGFLDQERFQVKLAFDAGQVTTYIKERIWSQDQEITELDDGRIELTFTSTSWEETISWILSFGDSVEVISPPELVDDVLDRTIRVIDIYHNI